MNRASVDFMGLQFQCYVKLYKADIINVILRVPSNRAGTQEFQTKGKTQNIMKIVKLSQGVKH